MDKVCLPNKWKLLTLGDLFEITSSKRVFKEDWKIEGVPFYRAREIVKLSMNGYVNNELFISEEMFKEYSEKYGIPKPNDIMVTGVGTLGICYVVKKGDRFYFKDGNIIWLKSNGRAYSQYVEYAFKSDYLRRQIDDSIGATVGTFTIIKAKNTKIPIPPLSEQQRIVSILDECFAAIDKAKSNTVQNLKNAKELFESYLQGVFSVSIGSSNKRVGWEEKSLKELTTKIGSGATPRGGQESYITEGISLVRSMNVHDWKFRDTNLAFIDEKQAKQLEGVTLQENDVLLNITGASVARCCVFPKDYLPARVNQHVSIIRPKKDLLDSIFLNLLLTSKPYKNMLLFNGEQGATRQAITKAQIESFRISIPPLPEQQSIVRQLETLRSVTQKLEAVYQQKSADLDELKKSILQKAFAGELSTS